VATSTYSSPRRRGQLRPADAGRVRVGRLGRRARWFSHRRRRKSCRAPTRHIPDQLGLPHHWAAAVFDAMQRARFIPDGAVYLRRRLSQLSPRISTRLSKRREAVGVGPDKMVDLDSIEGRLDERSTTGAGGSNLLQASATPGFTEG